MNRYILVIGQIPPPVHGSNVMTERFMNALSVNGYRSLIVEKTFSKRLDEVGKASYRKMMKVPGLCNRVLKSVRKYHPAICFYFISIGLQSLLVDCLVLGLLRITRTPYILYFHGQGFKEYENRHLVIRRIIRSALRNAYGGMVLGDRLKEDIKHCINCDRLFILPNGIPSSNYYQKHSKQKYGDTIKITFLSNLIPTKGPMTFLIMAKKVIEQEPKVSFIMAGPHAKEAFLHKLKKYILEEKLERHVSLIGPVYNQEKDELLSHTDILVFPTNKDVFPLVNIEAMNYGVPIVSSSIGAIPEIIKDGINGFIVDPHDIDVFVDRVLRLIRDGNLRKKMGEAGRKLFEENYSLDAYYRNTKRAIEYFMRLKGANDTFSKACYDRSKRDMLH